MVAGYRADTPFTGLRNVRLPQRVVQPFTPADVVTLLAQCNPADAIGRRDRAIVLTLLDTGIRCSEAVGLDLSDCDLPAGRLRIRHGKGDKQRVAPFADRCRAAPNAYLADRGLATGPLFVTMGVCTRSPGCVPTGSNRSFADSTGLLAKQRVEGSNPFSRSKSLPQDDSGPASAP